jgi:hypothetical protein
MIQDAAEAAYNNVPYAYFNCFMVLCSHGFHLPLVPVLPRRPSYLPSFEFHNRLLAFQWCLKYVVFELVKG